MEKEEGEVTEKEEARRSDLEGRKGRSDGEGRRNRTDGEGRRRGSD